MWMSTQRMETGVAEPRRADVVDIEFVDHSVGRSAGPAVVLHDVRRGLVRLGPHIRVRVVGIERDRVGLAPEGLAEPSVLGRRQVLDQAQQARPGRGHRPPHLRVVQALELPHHDRGAGRG